MRHANSSWKDADLADIDRPLNKRGKRDCQFMGRYMEKANCDFNNVYCSPAQRAQSTINGLMDGLYAKAKTYQTVQDLYTFEYCDLVEFCHGIDNKHNSVVIVGHNPALTDLCHYLIPDCKIENIPTCAYVQLSLGCSTWAAISKGCGRLECFIYPKQFL